MALKFKQAQTLSKHDKKEFNSFAPAKTPHEKKRDAILERMRGKKDE